jgi:hypothetical protein
MGRLSIGAGWFGYCGCWLVRPYIQPVGAAFYMPLTIMLFARLKARSVEKEAVVPQDKGDDSKPVRCLGRTQVRFSTLPLPPVLLPSKLVIGGQRDGRYDQPQRASY